MGKIIEISNFEREELNPYIRLTDVRMRCQGFFVAESPKVIERALEAGLTPLSLLCERKHIDGDAATIINRFPSMPVFTGDREILSSLTGYTLTRGVLCAFRRPPLPESSALLEEAKRVCVIYDICDATNIGVIFRCAAALGFDGVIVSKGSCDPLNRRAIRVSMGTVFQIPWIVEENIMEILKQSGFTTASAALSQNSVFLQDFKPEPAERYAVILGSEGYGLPSHIIEASDLVVKIPMSHGVDSLNVGAAAAIFLWHFSTGL